MNTSFLFFPKKAVRNTVFGLLATIMSVPAQAQQYRFSAGIQGGSFYAPDRADFGASQPLLRQGSLYLNYNISQRWSAGISVAGWMDLRTIYSDNKMPTLYYNTKDSRYADLQQGSVTARMNYTFYDVQARYQLLVNSPHKVYGGAGLSLITGNDESWKGDYIYFDMGEPAKALVMERITKMGGMLQAGYSYQFGKSKHLGIGADLTGRFASKLPLQLYYGISLNYHFIR